MTETLPEDREISSAEAASVRWLLLHGSVVGDLSHLAPWVSGLRVVGRCSYGCPSVDFKAGGQALGATPVANALGKSADGVAVGVILWERDGSISGLEFYDVTEPVRSLPLVESLSVQPPS